MFLMASMIAVCIVTVNAATISGVVSDTGGAAVANALVTLAPIAGGGNASFDTTDAAGNYHFANVAAGTYTLNASNAGYTISATSYVNFTNANSAVEQDITLVPRSAGVIISGTVIDTVAGQAGTPVAGAKVVLQPVGGGTGGVRDSAVTVSGGTYSIDSVQAGRYTITASASGYVSQTTANITVASAAITRNFKLQKIANGNLYVVVLKHSDSAAIAGAAVSAALQGGASLTGNTDAGGYIAFETIATGRYAITASAAGFTPINVNGMVERNLNDTVKIFLTAATAGTKILTGTITDSASKAGLASVRVVLQIAGTGAAGAALVLFDSTNKNGVYSIVGIPVNSMTGTITATGINYRNYSNNQVTLGQVGQADTAHLNFAMARSGAGTIFRSNAKTAHAQPEFSVSKAGTLRLCNINDAGTVKVFGLDGKLLYQNALDAHTASLTIPSKVVKSGSVYIVAVVQKDAVYCKRILIL
jgi:hypothetical protein